MIVEVAGHPIYGMHHHGVPRPDETEQGHQLRALGVFARGAVGERAIDGDPVELPGGVLIQCAHPGVGDALPADRALPAECVRLNSEKPVVLRQSTAIRIPI